MAALELWSMQVQKTGRATLTEVRMEPPKRDVGGISRSRDMVRKSLRRRRSRDPVACRDHNLFTRVSTLSAMPCKSGS